MPQIPCWSCSRAVYDIASVCPHCGAPLKEAGREYPAAAPPNAAAAPYSVPQPSLREYPAPPQQWTGAAGAAVPYPYGPYAPYAQAAEVPVEMAGEFHPLAIHKLVVMSVSTLGLYNAFWFYRNWKRVRERTGQELSPFWRAFFAPLWAYSLFEEVDDEALRRQIQSGWSSVVLAIVFFVLSVTWRLPDPWALLSMFSFLPLIPVQNTINQMAERRGVRPNAQFGVWHVAVMLLGALFLLMAAVGAFLAAA